MQLLGHNDDFNRWTDRQKWRKLISVFIRSSRMFTVHKLTDVHFNVLQTFANFYISSVTKIKTNCIYLTYMLNIDEINFLLYYEWR